MSLNIDKAITKGYTRTLKINGIIIVSIIFLINSINTLFGIGTINNLIKSRILDTKIFNTGSSLIGNTQNAVFTVPNEVVWILTVILNIIFIFIIIVSTRLFVGFETENIPRKYFTRNIFWAFLNFLLAGIIFLILTFIGLVLMIIPGIFIFVTLVFWTVYISVEDQNFIESFRSSWHLTESNRWSIFGLCTVIIFILLVINIIFSIPLLSISVIGKFLGSYFLIFGKVLAILISQIGYSFTIVFSISTIANTYRQLKAN